MTDCSVYLGIDLGTTDSAAAVFDGARMRVIRLAHAERALDPRPPAFDSEPVRTRLPIARAAEVLTSLREHVQARHGFLATHAVITVPARLEPPRAAATREAARRAGFVRIELLQAPIAAALAALSEHFEQTELVARGAALHAASVDLPATGCTPFDASASEAIEAVCRAATWLTLFGSALERRRFDAATAAMEKARRARDTRGFARHLRTIDRLGEVAYRRHPDAWREAFTDVARQAGAMHDAPAAEALIARGREALGRDDAETVRRVTRALLRMLPPPPRR
ncbi:MAG: Hsp70 family protein [Polyangiales bacterium]